VVRAPATSNTVTTKKGKIKPTIILMIIAFAVSFAATYGMTIVGFGGPLGNVLSGIAVVPVAVGALFLGPVSALFLSAASYMHTYYFWSGWFWGLEGLVVGVVPYVAYGAVAWLVYRKKRTRARAAIGLVAGVMASGAVYASMYAIYVFGMGGIVPVYDILEFFLIREVLGHGVTIIIVMLLHGVLVDKLG